MSPALKTSGVHYVPPGLVYIIGVAGFVKIKTLTPGDERGGGKITLTFIRLDDCPFRGFRLS
jgi:hypothetical protein